MASNYSYQHLDKETMAVASGRNLSISMKKTVELARAIQGKKVKVAISYLEKVIDKKVAVPYRRFKQEVPHQRGKGIDTGGYPVNVAKEVLKLLKSAQKNASEKELGDNLFVVSISARKGASRYHPGRYVGRRMKVTNVEVVVGVKE